MIQSPLTIRSNPFQALFAVRPWLLLGLVIAFLLARKDLVAAAIVSGVLALIGLIDAVWTYFWVGRNRVEIVQDRISLVSGRRVLGTEEIGFRTAIEVDEPGHSFLEYISAAYLDWAEVRLVNSGVSMTFMAKGTREIEDLRCALRCAIEQRR